MSSLLPTPEPPDPVEGATGHFEHSNWVKASLKALDAGTVHAVGGSSGALAVDGLTVNPAASETARIVLQGNSTKDILGKSASAIDRWQLILGDGTAEGGSNSGSLFKLYAFADNGALLHTVLQADRNSGLVEVKGSPTAVKGIATKEYVDSSMPIGAIISYGGAAAPTGWHICNGTAHGSSALQAIIGSANTPDLSGRFIVGAGTGYSPKATGGVETVTLTPAQTATKGHTHAASSSGVSADHHHLVDPPNTGTSGRSADHQHYVSLGGGGHAHNSAYGNNWQGSTQDQNPAGTDYGPIGWNAPNVGGVFTNGAHGHEGWSGGENVDHSHSVDIAPFWSGGVDTDHTHTIAVTATVDANATASHENRPPFYALIYIIKKA